ncbi:MULTISPECIES: hypothetical protein [Mycobacteriaceae]|uniref:hypothetical protein n=1 Tax=Mycobacteriaceae TaxID=1762 RepID=UPI0007FD1FF8|nr:MULTISPECIES: hypothetical protein [Mycobacteriaceae]MCK0177304.1 hypothetical protein [Mycolicibacterium sp. F2034L]OBB57530.1 hypothetical protein A5757_20435 [Mycobacterium sp. 852013-51886_SCH5428379]
MSTAAVRAGALCGALVGLCSALLTAAAHTAVAGTMPSGAAAALVLLISGSLGAVSGAAAMNGFRSRAGSLAAALVAGQVLGHIALSLAHGGHDLLPSATMFAAHTVAAVALGLLISLVTHLYVVCASVLCWLSLFLVHRGRPVARPVRATRAVVVRPVLFHSGWGMRAPPRLALS